MGRAVVDEDGLHFILISKMPLYSAHRNATPRETFLYAQNNLPHNAYSASNAPVASSEVTAKDLVRIIRRRWPISALTFVAVCGAAAAFTAQQPKVYDAQARILIESAAAASTPAGVADFLRPASSPLDTEIEKIRSRSFLERIAAKTHPLKETDPDAVRAQITLSAAGQILSIGARARTAEEAQALANTTARVYMASTQAEFDKKTDASEHRLRLAANQTEQDKIIADKKLARFMARVGFSDPSIFYSQRATKTVTMQNGLEDAKKALPLQEAQLARYIQQARTIPPTIATGYSQNKNPVIDGFRAELVNLSVRRKSLLNDYAEDSDEVKFVDDEIAARQKEVEQAQKELYSKGSVGFARNPDYAEAQSNVYRTQNAVAATRNEIAASTVALSNLQTEQKHLAQQRNEYEGLVRAQQSATGAYERTRQGLINMRTTRLTTPPHLELLDKAQLPPAPISPKPLMNALMAVFMGLFLGLGVAVLAEYFSATGAEAEAIDDHNDLLLGLPHVAGVPLLGRVPLSSLPAPAATGMAHAALQPGLLDAVREVGYVLAHGDVNGKPPVVLFAGTQNTDATAALSAQIAAALSHDGLRVTLVDADRTRPRLNRVFGAPDAPGLADVLAGRVRARDILHVGADGALRFMAAGAPDDAAPTTEAGAREVFNELADSRDTDIVIVSGPTVWSARRIGPLEKAASGMVIVAEQNGIDNASPDETVVRARRMLSNGYRPRLLGVVVSAAPVETSVPAPIPASAPAASQPTLPTE